MNHNKWYSPWGWQQKWLLSKCHKHRWVHKIKRIKYQFCSNENWALGCDFIKNCSNEGILCQAVIAKKKNIVMTNLRTACLCTVLLSWSLSASVNLSAMDNDDSELCCIIWWVLLITLSSVFWSTTACHSTQIQQLV